MVPWAHPSPQAKRQVDRFSRFCKAHGRKSLYFTMGVPFPKNCLFPWGIWTPSNLWFLGPIRSQNPNNITIGSAVFDRWPQSVPILYNGPPLPPQNFPFPWDVNLHLTHGSLSPPKSSTQTASRSVQPFLQSSRHSVPTPPFPPQNCQLPWGI